MKYTFRCYEHDLFEVEAPISEGPPSIVYCPTCHEESMRVFDEVGTIWKTNGAHGRAGHYLGDYGKHGHKEDLLRKNIKGGKSLTPAKDVV